MHPLDPIQQALAPMPPTINDLLELLPRGQLTPVSTREDATAQKAVEDFHRVLAFGHRTGAIPLPNGQGWFIECASGWGHLIGHAFPAPAAGRGDLALNCPLVLLNRQTREVIYGPELPSLAATCLGNTLRYQAIRALQD